MRENLHFFPALAGDVGRGDGQVGGFGHPQRSCSKSHKNGRRYHCVPRSVSIHQYPKEIGTHASHHGPFMSYFADHGGC